MGETKRLFLVLDAAFYRRIDRARRRVDLPAGVTRADFLRRALSSYLLALAGGAPFEPAPQGEGDRQPSTLNIRSAMRREVDAAAAHAGVSVAELVRSAGHRLARELGL